MAECGQNATTGSFLAAQNPSTTAAIRSAAWAPMCTEVLRLSSFQSQTHRVLSPQFPGRDFQLWSYEVGHAMLLLRSPKDANHLTRVEIAFKNVHAIKLPTALNDVAISVADERAAQLIRKEAGVPKEGGEVFLIEGGGGTKGYVVAGIAFGQEDEGDWAEPSPLLSGRWNGPGWQLPEKTQRS